MRREIKSLEIDCWKVVYGSWDSNVMYPACETVFDETWRDPIFNTPDELRLWIYQDVRTRFGM